MVTSLVLAHLNKAKGPVAALAWKAVLQAATICVFKLLFKNVTETERSSRDGGKFLEPRTKAASFPNYCSHGV